MRESLYKLMCLLSGLLIGYFVWQTYFLYDPPDWVVKAIINKKNSDFFTHLLGSIDAAETAMITIFMVVQSIPGSAIFGILAGIVVHEIRYKRLFSYAPLGWPILLFCWSYIALLVLEENFGSELVSVDWNRRAQHIQAQFAMFSVFYIFMYCAFKIKTRSSFFSRFH